MKLSLGFQEAVHGKESIYPLLARAVAYIAPAHSIKVEWLVPNAWGKLEAYENYCQIVRTTFSPPTSMEEALEKHLDAVEKTLEYGAPSYSESGHVHFAGGVRHYLSRDLLPSDRLQLRVFRDLALYTDRGGSDRTDEWISEFSLVIFPART